MRKSRTLTTAAVLVLACTKADVVAPTASSSRPTPRVSAVVEIKIDHIGTSRMTSSAIVGSSVASVNAIHEARAAAGRVAQRDLTVPPGTTGDTVAIQLRLRSAAAVTAHGSRYVYATYDVRNAQRSDSAALNTPRHNLTFVAVSTPNTIGDTPVRALTRDDGSDVPVPIARELKPTGLVTTDGSGNVVAASSDILQVFTEPEIAAVAVPRDVTNTFPYGFVVHRQGSDATRTLDASPTADQFDGVVTFAYRIPLQANPGDDPTSIVFMMLALDDSETRLTQSLEEQANAAAAALRQRAASLGATAIRVLPGGLGQSQAGIPTQLICSVRTAGPASAATVNLVDVHADFQGLTPNPYEPSGSAIPRLSGFRAAFSQLLSNAGPSNFIVRGLQSGQQFRGAMYTATSSGVSTPAASLLPGEEVEVVITSALTCPTPWVGRDRVQVATRSSATFAAPVLPTVGQRPRAVAIGDYNRDGILDIAVVNYQSNGLTILLGDGTGAFNTFQTFSTGNGPLSIVAADFNGDGKLDLATANANSNDISVLIGAGDGTFGSATSFALAGSPAQLVVGDINADGALDIVVANVLSSNLSIFISNGDGTFQPQVAVPTPSPRSVALGDLNEDGVLDVAVANNTGFVSVFLGRGDGTFTAQTPVAAGTGPFTLVRGDLNRDGHQDLVVANLNSGNTSLYLGNGNGTFQPQQLLATGTGTIAVALGDLNGDGILDLAVGNQSGGVMSIFLGNGDGTFQARQTTSVGVVSPSSLVLADLNRDGILDAVVANSTTSSNVFAILKAQP